MKTRRHIASALFLTLVLAFIVWGGYRRREAETRLVARWHYLQDRQFQHDFQEQRHAEYGDAVTVPALTPAERTELSDLERLAEERGEHVAP